jgi:putative two-component system response regulator
MTARPPNIDITALEAEAKERLNKTLPDNREWFVETANFLLRQDATFPDRKSLLEVLSLCMRYFYASRERQLAIVVGEYALSIAVETQLPLSEASFCNMMGIFHKDSGKYVSATEYFVRGIAVARRIADREGEGKIWGNMASLANIMARHDDAIIYAQRSLLLAAGIETDTSQRVSATATQIIARASQALGRFEEAIVSIRLSKRQMPAPKSAFDYLMHVRRNHTHAVIALRLNELDEARDAVAAAEHNAIRCVGTEAAIQASIARTMVDARTGDYTSADATSQQLLSDHGSDSTLGFDCYVARIYFLEQANRLEEAEALRRRFRSEWQKQKMKDVIAQLHTLDAAQPGEHGNSQAAARAHLEELAIIGELHDDSTGERAFRVGRLSALLALRVGMSQQEAEALDLAARLYDIGKVVIPTEVIAKPALLMPDERKVMQEHAAQGHKILSTRDDPLLKMAADIAFNHHERWDGRGYPAGLKGSEIPLVAQIVGLADVFDALCHARSYKPAWTIEAALAEIERVSRGYSEQQFEMRLTDKFIAMVRELVTAYGEQGLDTYLAESARQNSFYHARATATEALDVVSLTGMADASREDAKAGTEVKEAKEAKETTAQVATSSASSVAVRSTPTISPSIMSLCQLIDVQLRHLTDEAARVHTRAGMWQWARGPLREAVPHQHALLAFGHCHSLGIKLRDLASIDLPEGYLATLQRTEDELASPILERWLAKREMMHITAASFAAPKHAAWRSNFDSHGLRNVLIDGHVNEAAQTVVLLKFYNCHPHAVAAMTGLGATVLAALEGMWVRIAQAEAAAIALARTDRLKNVAALSAAEKEVLKWVKLGKTNIEIAQILGKSEFTVKTQVQKILDKTHAVNRTALAGIEL